MAGKDKGKDNGAATVLQLVRSGAADEGAQAVAELRRAIPALQEYNRLIASVQRNAYVAYIKEGFTPAQALELCKAMRL
jgi:hypothetical protein